MNIPTMTIMVFEGPDAFLSNFHPSPMVYDGMRFPTAEHAFQAAKARDKWDRGAIAKQPTPGKAKRLGRSIAIRSDWEDIKRDVMKNVVREKFRQNPDLMAKFKEYPIGTKFIEGNTWHDNTWGSCYCEKCGNKGTNWLGIILEELRYEFGQ